MKSNNLNDEMLQSILKELKKQPTADRIGGVSQRYSDDWYDVPWGWNSDVKPIDLPEVIVKPNSVSISKESSNDTYTPYTPLTPYVPHQDISLEGSIKHLAPNNYTKGNIIVDHFISSILNNTAIWCKQAQDTKTFQIANATSVVDGMPNIMYDIISVVKADQGIIKSFGDAMVKGNTALNTSVAIIACMDGETTPSDWLNLASAVTGIAGTACSLYPPVAITLDGISFCLSLAALFYDATSSRGGIEAQNGYNF